MTITSNKTKRHYTIKFNGTTYRTYQMSKVEFEEAWLMTEGDWKSYIRCNSVIVVK